MRVADIVLRGLLGIVLISAVVGGAWAQYSASMNIVGHWHVTDVGPEAEVGTYSVLDVYEDGTACFDCDPLRGGWGFRGAHDTWNQALTFVEGCILRDFTYQLVGDTLQLYQRRYSDKSNEPVQVAVRHEYGQCDKYVEHFRHKRTAVQLPKTIEPGLAINDSSLVLLTEVCIGRLKPPLGDSLSDIFFESKIGIQKINYQYNYNAWWEQLMKRRPKHLRFGQQVVIYADEKVEEGFIEKIAEKLREEGVQQVYRGVTFEHRGQKRIGLKAIRR